MIKVKCCDCENEFDKEDLKESYTTYEEYYGVGTMFSYGNKMTLYTCPYCKSENWQEVDIENDEEEEEEC